MNKGFTLIEWLIVVSIIGIVASVLVPIFMNTDDNGSVHTTDIEERCISGYKFVVSSDGRPSQIMNSEGKGVSCP